MVYQKIEECWYLNSDGTSNQTPRSVIHEVFHVCLHFNLLRLIAQISFLDPKKGKVNLLLQERQAKNEYRTQQIIG